GTGFVPMTPVPVPLGGGHVGRTASPAGTPRKLTMKPLLLTAALLAVVAFAARAEDKDRLADEAKIQGTWAIVSGESDGKAVPDDKIKDSAVVIGKDSLHVRDGKNNKT